VNERFDPYTAKRVVGRIGMGASLGGVAGGLLALGVSRLVRVPTMLALLAGLSVVAVLALLRFRGPTEPQAASDTGEKTDPSPLAGLRILGEVGYLRQVAAVVCLMALTETLLDYTLNATAAASFPRGRELMFFFAAFHTGVGLVALAIQTSLARRSLQVLGLAGTVAVLPIAIVGGGLAGVLAPRLASAIAARGLAGAFRNSLFRSGYELLFTPLVEHKKRPTKAIVDVGFDKLGSLLGGGIAMAAVVFAPNSALRALFGLCAVAAVAAVYLARRLHGGYVGALEESLRSGSVRLDSQEVVDSTTRFTLAQTGLVLERETLLRQIQDLRAETAPAPGADVERGHGAGRELEPLVQDIVNLRSPRPAAIRRVLIDGPDLNPLLVAHVIPLLARNDVFIEAVRALRRVAPQVTGQLVDALADPTQPAAVRRRLPRVLKACDSQRALDGLVLGLQDESFEVRHQAGIALARISERNPGLEARDEQVLAVVRRELQDSSAGRSDEAIQRLLEHVFNLLSLTLEREPLRISYWAVRSRDTLRGTALEYLDNVLPEDVRRALWPLLGVRGKPSRGRRTRQEVEDELVRSGSFSRSQLSARLARRRSR
jgi:hypothetical protein